MQIDLLSFKCSYFKIFLELTSANKILLEISNLFKKSLSFVTFEISGGFN